MHKFVRGEGKSSDILALDPVRRKPDEEVGVDRNCIDGFGGVGCGLYVDRSRR